MDPSTNNHVLSAAANANASLTHEADTKHKKAECLPAVARISDRVLEQIFSYLPVRGQAQANSVSRRWNAISQSPRLSLHLLRQLEKIARSEVQILKTFTAGQNGQGVRFNFCSDHYIGLEIVSTLDRYSDFPCMIDRKQFAEVQGLPGTARIADRQGDIAYLLSYRRLNTFLHLVNIHNATEIKCLNLGEQHHSLWLFAYEQNQIALVNGDGQIALWDISGKDAVRTKQVQDPQINLVWNSWKLGNFIFIHGTHTTAPMGRHTRYLNSFGLPELNLICRPTPPGCNLGPTCFGNDCLAYGPSLQRIDHNGNIQTVWDQPSFLKFYTRNVHTNGREVMAIDEKSNQFTFCDFLTGTELFSKTVNFPQKKEESDQTNAILKNRIALCTKGGSNLKIIDLASQRCFSTYVEISVDDPISPFGDKFFDICDALPFNDELLLMMHGGYTLGPSSLATTQYYHLVRLGTDRLRPAINEAESKQEASAPRKKPQKQCIVM